MSSVVFLKTHEPFGGLSNMAGGYPLLVQGVRIFSSEALYQACRFPHLPEVQRSIITQASPMTAKMKSKPYRKESRPDWDQVRIKVMRWCLRVKLSQNWLRFSDLLLRTGDRPIVEESRKDDFWGAKSVDDQTLVGMNVLGRLLMELREIVRSTNAPVVHVEPLDIPDFLLLGRHIEAIHGHHESAEHSAAGSNQPRKASPGKKQSSLFEEFSSGSELLSTEVKCVFADRSHSTQVNPYPVLKDSAVPGLGQLPNHWEISKLRRILRRVTERGRPDLPLLSVVREKGVILRDMTSADDNHNFIPDDLSNYKVVRTGQFALNKMKAWQGSYGISKYEGIVSPAYFVFDVEGVDRSFFHLAIRSKAYVRFFTQASDGVRIGQWDLVEARMKEIPFFVPSLSEQATIVRFLNHVDRRIRRYMLAKQKLIKVLEEQKQAIINRAVTRGIGSNIRLKPAGVEWLGDVPEHWNVMPIKRAFVSMVYGISESATNEGAIRLLTMGHIRNGEVMIPADGGVAAVDPTLLLEKNDLLFNRTNSAELVGKVGLFEGADEPVTFASYLVRMRPRPDMSPEFLNLLLNNQSILSAARREAIPSLHQSNLNPTRYGRLHIAVPDLTEQVAIVNYVASSTIGLRMAVDRTQGEIDLLLEYRTRLITDVVTGKLDVREVAANLPIESEEPESLNELIAGSSSDVESIETLDEAQELIEA